MGAPVTRPFQRNPFSAHHGRRRVGSPPNSVYFRGGAKRTGGENGPLLAAKMRRAGRAPGSSPRVIPRNHLPDPSREKRVFNLLVFALDYFPTKVADGRRAPWGGRTHADHRSAFVGCGSGSAQRQYHRAQFRYPHSPIEPARRDAV